MQWLLKFIGSEAWSYVATFVLVIVASGVGIVYKRVTTTLIEAGEFLTVLGNALADNKITREELKDIIKEGREVFNPWRKTPDAYKVK